jgi:hypothetical protein
VDGRAQRYSSCVARSTHTTHRAGPPPEDLLSLKKENISGGQRWLEHQGCELRLGLRRQLHAQVTGRVAISRSRFERTIETTSAMLPRDASSYRYRDKLDRKRRRPREHG